ncbi:MAG: peptide MFS transporter [Ignavibacteriaceae bacterium]
MFKGHPKGLLVAAITNMGERFGFYTMMAILVLFLQTKFGLSENEAGDIYSWFYFGIYALALAGGIAADYSRKYKIVILIGIVIMFGGYLLIATPGMTLTVTIIGLFLIAFGNGLFKGNLQAVVGQLYDDPQYSKLRDSAFMLFYMGINVGAFFAPFVATGIRNWWLETNGFLHDGSLPALCHQVLKGTLTKTEDFLILANKVNISGTEVTDAKLFAQQYIDLFSQGYNYAFGIAGVAMIVSLAVYLIFFKMLPNKEKVVAKRAISEEPKSKGTFVSLVISLVLMGITTVVFYYFLNNYALGLAVGLFVAFVSWIFQVSTKEELPRVVSLVLVFIVVIFFWMSFHQNGLTLTFFARDYVVKEVDGFTFLFFTLESILSVIIGIAGVVMMLLKNKTVKFRSIGALMGIVGGGLSYYFFQHNSTSNPISPEIFQSFNPLFIVSLTPLVMGIFTLLGKKEIEPSTPKKIGIGMIIASLGFVLILIASVQLISPSTIKANELTDYARVTPYYLISSYLILTIAELFLSPMGLSFVSKVAPPRFQGLMQSGWLLATAIGNKLLFVGSYFWGILELWQVWAIFVVCCLLSAAFIFSIMKRLEKSTS